MTNFLGTTPPLDRKILVHLGRPGVVEHALFRQLKKHARLDHPDEDGVGADAMLALFAREPLHQRFVRRLGRDRQAILVGPAQRARRPQMDERAAALFPHMRDEVPRGVEKAMNLDVDRAAPLFGRRIGEMNLRDERPGAPQHRVDAPMRSNGVGDRTGQRHIIGNVTLVQARLTPRRLDGLGQHLGLRLFRAPHDRNVAPRRRKFARDRRANAARCAENQRRAFGKLCLIGHGHSPGSGTSCMTLSFLQ